MKIDIAALRDALVAAGNAPKTIALDTETTSLNKRRAKVTWISWAIGDAYGAIPVKHRRLCGHINCDAADLKALTTSLLEDPAYTIVFHNAGYDLQVLASNGFVSLDKISATIRDTMVESRVMSPAKTKEGKDRRHKLKLLFGELLQEAGDPPQPSFENVRGDRDFCDVVFEDAAWYAAFDAWSTLRVHRVFTAKLATVPALLDYYQRIEVPHIFTQMEIERAGISLADPDDLGPLDADLLERGIGSTKSAIFELVGKPFNLDSSRALQAALFFGRANIRPLGRSKTGKGYNLSATVLEELLGKENDKENQRLLSFVLVYKMLQEKDKLISRFYNAVDYQTGRAHTQLDSAVTGRFSTKGINTLALSSSSGVKDVIKAPEGRTFVLGDYGQIDFRVLANEAASLAPNSKMARLINDDYDLHLATLGFYFPEVRALNAKRLWKEGDLMGIYPTKGPREPFEGERLEALRRISRLRGQLAKRINFGISYGMGPAMLALNLNYNEELHKAVLSFPMEVAPELDDPSPESLAALNAWMKRIKDEASKTTKEDGFKYSIEEVEAFLAKFNIEYAELGPVKRLIEDDLQTYGATSNMFGRLCDIAIAPHFWDCVLDIEPSPGNFFRAKIRMLSMTKKAVCCSFIKVERLTVEKNSRRIAKHLFTDHKRIAKETIYELDARMLAELLAQASGDPSALETLRGIHAEAAFDADTLFDQLKAATLGDLDLTDSYPAALERVPAVVFVPHSCIRAVLVPELGIDLHYPGYGKMLRELVSARVQSSSMDFCKIAMAAFRAKAKTLWDDPATRPFIFNCVHDEIAVECREEDADSVKDLLKTCMEDGDMYKRHLAPGAQLLVKIDADVNSGKTYAKAKP